MTKKRGLCGPRFCVRFRLYRQDAGRFYRLHFHVHERQFFGFPIESQRGDQIGVLVGNEEVRDLIRGVITFEYIEIPGRNPAAQGAVSKTELPVGIAAERRDALVAPPAGDKEIFAVTGEADGTADTSIVSCGGLHESFVGCRVADS